MLFGVWALVHVAVFSTQQGIFHPYYVSALAPAVAALVGLGIVALWRRPLVLAPRASPGTAWLAVELLGRTAGLRALAAASRSRSRPPSRSSPRCCRAPARRVAVLAVTGAFALVAGPASYAVANLGHALNGNNVLAGPSSVSQGGFGGGPGGGGPPSGGGGPRRLRGRPARAAAAAAWAAARQVSCGHAQPTSRPTRAPRSTSSR